MARRTVQLLLVWLGLWIVSLCYLARDACGQIVFPTNYDSNNPIYIWDVGTATMKLAPFSGTFVQVLGRPAGSTGDFQVIKGSGRSVFTMAEPGFFDGGIGAVPGVTGGIDAEIVIRAWHGATTWDQATGSPAAFVGQSPIFVNATERVTPIPGPQHASQLNAPSFTMYPLPMACRLVEFIGPKPFCFSVTPSQAALLFQWTDIGTNYLFTLQSKDALTRTNWIAEVGPWPSRTNQWSIAKPAIATRFYRVLAQPTP